jgi:hypothetical protein
MSSLNDPIRRLRRMLEYTPHPDVNQMIRDRDHAIGRYREVFTAEAVARITADEFAGFLLFENNRHWWGMQRGADRMTNNLDLLRWALGVLVDEDRPVSERVNEIDDPSSGPAIPGFDHSIYTPVLLMAAPDRHGVWNSISESAMRRLDLWPDLEDLASNGERYEQINEMILTVASELETDPWTLDAMWWAIEKEHDPGSHFVTRREAPSRTRSSSSPRPKTRKPGTTRKPSRPQQTTFLCQTCFQQKPLNLASEDPNTCVDCA